MPLPARSVRKSAPNGKPILVYVDPRAHARLKARAALENVPMLALIRQVIEKAAE